MKLKRYGFTLLELLVVVGILAALVALALPFYQDYVNQSKVTAAEADLQTFKKALTMYDQLENSMFSSTDMVPLIGTYLQDFRTSTGQTNPADPWGNDYTVRAEDGTIICAGPDGTINTVAPSRIAAGDDILVTWKPTFFVSSGRKVNSVTFDINFSRKVSTIAQANVTADSGGPILNMSKISDTIFRFTTTSAISSPLVVTVADNQVQAQDNKMLLAADRKPNNDPANTITITF